MTPSQARAIKRAEELCDRLAGQLMVMSPQQQERQLVALTRELIEIVRQKDRALIEILPPVREHESD